MTSSSAPSTSSSSSSSSEVLRRVLAHCSDFRTWNRHIASSPSRAAVPHGLIEFSPSDDFCRYLLSDNTMLPSDPRVQPPDWLETANREFEDETVVVRMAGWDDRCKAAFSTTTASTAAAAGGGAANNAPAAVPAFSSIVDQVQAVMQALEARQLPGSGVCVTGAFCTADDAGWAVKSNTPACLSLADVFTKLTASSKMARDFRRQADDAAATAATAPTMCFALRPWMDVNAATEFRVFVEDGRIVGICQRHMDQLFPHLFPCAVPVTQEQRDNDNEDDDAEEGENDENQSIEDALDDNGVGGVGDPVDEEGDDSATVNLAQAVRWARDLKQLVERNVVAPIVGQTEVIAAHCRASIGCAGHDDTQNEEVDDALRWLGAPTLVVDVIHEGPTRMQFPAYILGVHALRSLAPSPQKTDASDADLFRIFGSYAQLRRWDEAVTRYFGGAAAEVLPLPRIATSSAELIRDARQANRGALPVEFSENDGSVPPEILALLAQHQRQE